MWLVDYILTRSWTGAGKITLKYLVPLSFGELPPPGRSPRRRGRDLHQTKPEDRWVHPAGRLRVGHGRVRRPRLRISHGPHQLPAFYFPGLHTPPGEYDPPTSRCYTHRLFLGPVAHKHRGVVLSFFFFFCSRSSCFQMACCDVDVILSIIEMQYYFPCSLLPISPDLPPTFVLCIVSTHPC